MECLNSQGQSPHKNHPHFSHHYTERPSRASGRLTRSAGEMFGSLRSNLSAGASSFNQHVVRPLTETMEEASYTISRATEPLVQHLQLLGTRLQVRYMHAAQHKQWLPHFALMREAADWIEGIPKVFTNIFCYLRFTSRYTSK